MELKKQEIGLGFTAGHYALDKDLQTYDAVY